MIIILEKAEAETLNLLKKIGEKENFTVTTVDAFYVNDEVVSSTKIRNAIK